MLRPYRKGMRWRRHAVGEFGIGVVESPVYRRRQQPPRIDRDAKRLEQRHERKEVRGKGSHPRWPRSFIARPPGSANQPPPGLSALMSAIS